MTDVGVTEERASGGCASSVRKSSGGAVALFRLRSEARRGGVVEALPARAARGIEALR